MAYLTLGGTPYEVQHDAAVQDAPEFIGEKSRAFSGAMRDGRRAKKRSWSFNLIPLIETDYLAFETAVGIGTILTASGDFSNNVSVSVIVDIGAVSYIPTGATYMRVAQITLIEV